MKKILLISPKLVGLKTKKIFFRQYLGKNVNIFILDDLNKSNKPIILFGPNLKILDIKSKIS